MDCSVRKICIFHQQIFKLLKHFLSYYLMWNFLQAVQSPDMIQCIYGWREATVEAEYLFQKGKSNPLSAYC